MADQVAQVADWVVVREQCWRMHFPMALVEHPPAPSMFSSQHRFCLSLCVCPILLSCPSHTHCLAHLRFAKEAASLSMFVVAFFDSSRGLSLLLLITCSST